MYPIPIFSILTSSGVIPIPPGMVKKVVTLDYLDSSGDTNNSLAILLKDGRLFLQGANVYGELADGTRNERYDSFNLASTTAADIWAGDRCFLIKFASGGVQYAGLLAGLVGATAAGGADVVATTWTSLPSSITGTVTLANLKEVKGGFNNTIWWMNNGALYGSGQNTVGSLGSGNVNEISIPRLISSVALSCEASYNQTTYVNNAGSLRVCGHSRGVAGNNNTTRSFVNATFPETVYVKEHITTMAQTLVVGAADATSPTHYLYARMYKDTGYTKVSVFSSGFSSWTFPKGRHSFFAQIGNTFYGYGKNYTANLGYGYADAADGEVWPLTPELLPDYTKWDVSLMDSVYSMFTAVVPGQTVVDTITTDIGYTGTFMVYNGNLYFTGTWRDGKYSPLFDGGLSNPSFTPITTDSVLGVLATSLTTASLGICIVGGTKQLTYTVEPTDGKLFNIKYTTTDATKMTVNSSGLMTFVAEGGFDVGMTALNNAGTTLSDSSGGYASTLGMYTDSLSAMIVGETKQLVATISPTGAGTLPGMVVTYNTTDPAIATVDSNGLITAVAEGDCRIGCTAVYQGVVEASDSSYLEVTAPAPKELTPSPSSSLTLLNGYFSLPADGVITFPEFGGALIASQLKDFVVKVNDVVVPTASLGVTGSAIKTLATYPAGEYRLYIERASASVSASARTIMFKASPYILELWGGNNVGYATSPASLFMSGCSNLRRVTSDAFSSTTYTGTSVANLLAYTAITAIPSGLLSPVNFPNATTVSGLAAGCMSLTKVAPDLFVNLPKCKNYASAFANCAFNEWTLPYECLIAIPTTSGIKLGSLFQGNLNITDFNTIYLSWPGMVDYAKSMSNSLTSFFMGCTNMAGTAVPFCTAAGSTLTQTAMFRNDTKLSDYSSIPSSWK